MSNRDMNGFQTSGYITKKGTPNSGDARFNQLPPGDDITNQDLVDINEMPMKRITPAGYPGDGGFGNGD